MITRLVSSSMLLAVAAGIAANVAAGVASAQSVVTRPGTYELTLPGSERRYTLVIPRGYRHGDDVPLVIALHFGGPMTPFIGRSLIEQLVGPALSDLDAIIVAPDSAADGWANPTAEQHVIELLSFIEANYNVDPARTLVTGYSMGGAGTWYLAERRPELFEAAIPMAGRLSPAAAAADWRTPTYAINSTADELIAIAPVRAAVESLQAQGAPIEIVVIDDVTHFQVPRYRRYLRDAIPWVEQAWSQ